MTTQTTAFTVPACHMDRFEELVQIHKDCGASESLARESAWKFIENLTRELNRNLPNG